MVTYKTLELQEGTDVQAKGKDKKSSTFTLQKNDSMKISIKSHRAALDFDKQFIMKSVTSTYFDFKEEVELVEEKKVAGKKRKHKQNKLTFRIVSI